MTNGRSRSLLALGGFGLAVTGAALYGSRYSRRESRAAWYRDLEKPSFAPPKHVYPIVWTSLYALMAWSGWRIWSAAPSRERKRALRLWVSQLATNAKWSKYFFGLHSPTLALADAIALEGVILSYMRAARKVDTAAANAFIPYAAWVAFAAVLNSEIARLNPRET
ncbi:MAG: TspO/MBR family protein [Candidatus Sulfotelmatobacter sp.]|jgi:translocator protein